MCFCFFFRSIICTNRRVLTIFNGIGIASVANRSATAAITIAIHLSLSDTVNGRCAARSRSPSTFVVAIGRGRQSIARFAQRSVHAGRIAALQLLCVRIVGVRMKTTSD